MNEIRMFSDVVHEAKSLADSDAASRFPEVARLVKGANEDALGIFFVGRAVFLKAVQDKTAEEAAELERQQEARRQRQETEKRRREAEVAQRREEERRCHEAERNQQEVAFKKAENWALGLGLVGCIPQLSFVSSIAAIIQGSRALMLAKEYGFRSSGKSIIGISLGVLQLVILLIVFLVFW